MPPEAWLTLSHLGSAALGALATVAAAWVGKRKGGGKDEAPTTERGPALRASSASLPAIALPAGRPRILVVDDEPSFARIIRRALGHLDLEVDVAGTCAEARALADLHPYRLLLVDLSLPDGDGIALLADLRMRTLIYSGAAEEQLAAARSAGVADKVLDKGESLDALEAVVTELTKRA